MRFALIFVALQAWTFWNQGFLYQGDWLSNATLAVPWWLAWKLIRRKRSDPLDRTLFLYPTGDRFITRHLITSILILGLIGSGKSSGSGKFFARLVLRLRSRGVIFASNPDDREWWERLFKEAKRDDLKIYAPDTTNRRNVMAELLRMGSDSHEMAKFLSVISESQVEATNKGEVFWEMATARVNYCTIEACMQAYGTVDAPMMARFLSSCAYTKEAMQSEKFKTGFMFKTMKAAEAKKKNPVEQANFDLIDRFWGDEWINLDEKPRTSILASVNNTLFVLNGGILHEMLSTTTTEHDGWQLWDFSVSKYANSGKMLYAAVKYVEQTRALRNDFKHGDAVTVLFSDECHHTANSRDRLALAEGRKHGLVFIYMTQSLSNLKIALGSDDMANAFIGQFGHVIAHTVDPVTGDYLVTKVGEIETDVQSGSGNAPEKLSDLMEGKFKYTFNYGKERKSLMMARQFQTGLRNGGPGHRFKVDGWIIRTENFKKTGSNACFMTFDQR